MLRPSSHRLCIHRQCAHVECGAPYLRFVAGPGKITGAIDSEYSFAKHLDWPFRAFSLLLYFTDTNDLTGGHFAVHQGPGGRHVNRTVQVKRNWAVAHLSPVHTAWHSVPPFLVRDEYRKLIQIQASSSWALCRDGDEAPHGAPPKKKANACHYGSPHSGAKAHSAHPVWQRQGA